MKFEKIVFPGQRVEVPGAAIIDPKYHWLIERPTKSISKSVVRDRFLRGKPHCAVCGEQMGMRERRPQREKLVRWQQMGGGDLRLGTHFVCRHKHERRQHFFSNTVLENLALRCVKNTLDRFSYDVEFENGVRAQVLDALVGFEASMKDWQGRYEDAARAYELALDALGIKTSKAVHRDLAKRADEALAKKQEALASFDRSKTILDDVGRLLTELSGRLRSMSEHLATAKITYPWKPTEPDEQTLRDDVAAMIKSVNVRILERSAVAVFDLVLVKDEDGSFEIKRQVEIEEPAIRSVYDRTNNDRWLIADAFHDSTVRLTDAEFESLPQLLLPPKALDGLRLNIDITLVAAALKVEPYEIARPLSEGDRVRPIRLIRQGAALDAIITHLRQTRGPGFDLPKPAPMPHGREVVRLAGLRDPILLISNCDPKSGKTTLDDDQWASISYLFKDIVFPVPVRSIINAYFGVIRSGLPISMAHMVGSSANNVRWLMKPLYRHTMAEVVKRLLAREGYHVPDGYTRPRRISGHIPNTDDHEAIIEQMRSTMPRCDPAGASPLPIWFECPGLRFGLTTHEAYSDAGYPIFISRIQRRLLACLLNAHGELVPHETLRTVVLQAGGVGNMSNIHFLRNWLRRKCPYLAERLVCEMNVGYRISDVPLRPSERKQS